MTRRRVVTSALADADIIDAVDYYSEVASSDEAGAFIDELQDLQEHIAEFPSIGSSRFAIETGIPHLRDMTMKRFPYAVFYSDESDVIRVHRVLHTSRDIPAELVGD